MLTYFAPDELIRKQEYTTRIRTGIGLPFLMNRNQTFFKFLFQLKELELFKIKQSSLGKILTRPDGNSSKRASKELCSISCILMYILAKI
jgi:hypothetical protein